jgi:hypothetical protein
MKGPAQLTLTSASMSTTHHTHDASLCIDGSTTTFCHTAHDSMDPWLSVQLPSTTEVGYVVVYNREDCCYDRLSPLQIWVGASAGDYNSGTSASCGVDEVTLTTTATKGPFTFRCADGVGNALGGSFVTLVLPGASRTFHVAEVNVYRP